MGALESYLTAIAYVTRHEVHLATIRVLPRR